MGNFLKLPVTFLVTLVLAVSVTAAQPQTDPAAAVQKESERGNYRLINVDELWEIYRDGNRQALLIDTRQEWEFRTGHIDGAVHFSMEPTWFSRLIQRTPLAQALGPDKDRILIFY